MLKLFIFFVIDICVFVIMSNYMYLVLYVNKVKVLVLNNDEVFVCWYRFYKGMVFSCCYVDIK